MILGRKRDDLQPRTVEQSIRQNDHGIRSLALHCRESFRKITKSLRHEQMRVQPTRPRRPLPRWLTKLAGIPGGRGSPAVAMTIGIVVVALFAAIAGGVATVMMAS